MLCCLISHEAFSSCAISAIVRLTDSSSICSGISLPSIGPFPINQPAVAQSLSSTAFSYILLIPIVVSISLSTVRRKGSTLFLTSTLILPTAGY